MASLEYQETGYAVFNWGVSLKLQTTPFKKEPAAASGKIIRGVLNFGGDASNAIAFLWQRDAAKTFPRPQSQPGFDRRSRRRVFGARWPRLG